MADIGFSTGCLYKSKMTFLEKIRLFHSLGATAIEIHLEELQTGSSEETIKTLKKFSTITIHAPWKKGGYRKN